MAFGKSPIVVGAVGSFRQVGNAWNQSRTEKKSRSVSNIPSWVNEYKPPTHDVDTVRLIAGDYTVDDIDANNQLVKIEHLPFYPFIEHYDTRSKKRSICSAGPYVHDRNKRSPCHGCDLFWSSMKEDPTRPGKKKPGFMNKRDMSAFTVVDYSNYHRVEQTDERGQLRMNENTNKPYFSWVRCQKGSDGRGTCLFCDTQKEIRIGHRLHWPMGSDHYNTLLASEDNVGKTCAVCAQRNSIRSDAWLCANPECGEAIIDEKTRLSKKEIDEITTKRATCKHCGYEGFLIELISCTKCTPGGKIPRRATLFDVDIQVQRIEPADGTNRTTLSVSGFSDPHVVDKAFAELAKAEQLERIYFPTSLERQALLFQVTAAPVELPVKQYTNPAGRSPSYD